MALSGRLAVIALASAALSSALSSGSASAGATAPTSVACSDTAATPGTDFDKDGHLTLAYCTRDAKLHGPIRAFYPNGGLRYEGSYQDGRMSGRWIRYHES